MEQTSQSVTKKRETKANLGNPPLVEVVRNFSAPIERVWRAWSDPELLKQWWGPEGFTCPEAKMDFREGGKYQVAMKDADGKIVWSGGVFEKIIPNKKIVSTDNFTDKDGNVVSPQEYNMPGDWPEVQRVTVEFVQLNDRETRMNISHEGIPQEMHDDCVKGWDSSFNKMQKLVERS